MLSWIEDKSQVISRIRDRTSTLKIILKTKNDPFFLSWWIDHHSRIVGLENLLVFDNESDDCEVEHTYQSFGERLITVKFSGIHNWIHDTESFPELYSALRDSCKYYIFLDTDEMLMFLDGDLWVSDERIMQYIERYCKKKVYPTVWLYNAPGLRDVLECGVQDECYYDGLKYGKPLFSSAQIVTGFANHNCQVQPELIGIDTCLRLFVAHFIRLSPSQRIRANLHKLAARGVISADSALNEVLQMHERKFDDPNVEYYIREIIERMGPQETQSQGTILKGQVRLHDTGKLKFYSDSERNNFFRFTADTSNASKFLQQSFSPLVLPKLAP